VNFWFHRVDHEKNQVELTFRSGDISQPTASIALSDLSVGENVEAIVKKIETYGLFVEIKGSKISGLCHKSEVRADVFYSG
jgi:rRNA biogenesis protein RRP5